MATNLQFKDCLSFLVVAETGFFPLEEEGEAEEGDEGGEERAALKSEEAAADDAEEEEEEEEEESESSRCGSNICRVLISQSWMDCSSTRALRKFPCL